MGRASLSFTFLTQAQRSGGTFCMPVPKYPSFPTVSVMACKNWLCNPSKTYYDHLCSVTHQNKNMKASEQLINKLSISAVAILNRHQWPVQNDSFPYIQCSLYSFLTYIHYPLDNFCFLAFTQMCSEILEWLRYIIYL